MLSKLLNRHTFLGELADKHEKELAEHKDAHVEHRTTMETRLEYLEGLLGQTLALTTPTSESLLL